MKKMQENQEGNYYTPSVKELHVGYQCELYSRDEGWVPCTMSVSTLEDVDDGWEQVRTTFLTKEQIEAEGFKCYQNNDDWELYFRSVENDKQWVEISLDTDSHIVEVEKLFYTSDTTTNTDRLFKGIIPSVNEFKTILKLLKI